MKHAFQEKRAAIALCAALLIVALGTALSPHVAAADLTDTLGPKGLASLVYRGQPLLARADNGALQIVNGGPRFRQADGVSYDGRTQSGIGTPTAIRLDAARRTLTQAYPWGRITCVYGRHGDSLFLRLTVANASHDTLEGADIQVAELRFPIVPLGDTADPGQFGINQPHPLHEYPLIAEPKNTPAVLLISDGIGGVLDFCDERVSDAVTLTVPFTTDPSTKTQYPFWATFGPIGPGASQTAILSLRFGLPDASPAALASDLYRRYAAAHPFRLRCSDHRAIGTNFLATSETHLPTNPRGWFLNAKDVDVTTPAGIIAFRKRLLDYANSSIKVLKGMNAQGVITWDPEGEEYGYQTYYGDPRLVSRLAPEMEYKDASGIATVDAYFQKFRQAGLRVGVCLRPQQIAFVNGAPVQQDSPDPARILLAKLAYARKRWGCTLFYVDSTVDAHGGALPPSVFDTVTRANPDVLLLPENQTTGDYAMTAPFDSFFHHGVTSTPAGVRAVYPQAFSALYAPGDWANGTLDANHDKLVAAVRRGDILLFHGWYDALENAKIKRIYQEAESKKPGRE